MGLLEPSDWKAAWIEPGLTEDVTKPGPVPMVRHAFTLRGPVARARAYVTSLGLYEMQLNGQRVGDDLLTPGWTSYNKRLQYQVYDVTPLLKAGANAVGVYLGSGWYRGDLAGWIGRRNVYGDRSALLLQMNVTYKDGRQETVGTDASWKAAMGPILMSEIYHGETYDARLEKAGWSAPATTTAVVPVKTADHRKDDLVAPAGPPVRRIEELKPVRIFKTPGGDTVADMGQNMVGWIRLKADGAPGSTITLRHAEVLDKDGNFYTANLRSAKATLKYTLKGGPATFEPHFTFFGFRYVAVDGYPGELTPASLTGVVIHSDMARTGSLETSKPLVNQLQHNIVWGQKGNFLDVPTDCPQRDERMGWTGDAQVFARTAAFNMDVAAFFTKWLRDVAADQLDNGSVPFVVPDVLTRPGERPAAGSAAWADAAVIIPWNMYLSYGDRRVLEVQYPSMAKWVDYMKTRAGDDTSGTATSTRRLAHFAAPARSPHPGATTKDYIATAFFAHSTDLLRRTAWSSAVGRAPLRAVCRGQEAFNREYVTARGVGEQTAYALRSSSTFSPRAPARRRRSGWPRTCGTASTSRRASSARRTCATCSAATAISTRPTSC
jgi:alpha-L-rhamnosidase